MRLLFEPGDESACPLQCHVEIVDAEEQEEPVARWRFVRAPQGRMVVRSPLVEREQDGSVRIRDLTEVVMFRRLLGLAKERLVPLEAPRDVPYADDRPCAFHRIFGSRPDGRCRSLNASRCPARESSGYLRESKRLCNVDDKSPSTQTIDEPRQKSEARAPSHCSYPDVFMVTNGIHSCLPSSRSGRK